MRKIVENILAFYAKVVLSLHRPKIIGITGSVGKSSTKEAIALVLSEKFRVGATTGNYNTAIGLPLGVLGIQQSGGSKKNAFKWIWILISGFFRIFQFNFPEVLVLEMGADRPGDIAELLKIVGHLDIAVITDIGISHMEFFPDTESLAREKLSILKGLGKSGVAILNADNSKVLAGKNLASGKSLTYGFGPADIQARNFRMTEKNGSKGISIDVTYQNISTAFFIPEAIGKPAVYAVLAATTVGISMNMSLDQIAMIVAKYHQPAGRLRIIKGLNNTTIIDDTYNAAPSSTMAAFESMNLLPATRKVIALGHMAELGVLSEAAHRDLAPKIIENQINLVFLVGEQTKVIETELKELSFSGKIFWSPDSQAAAPLVKENLLAGDVVLVKGSQAARMERVVKAIMMDPTQAKNLLVRQTAEWLA